MKKKQYQDPYQRVMDEFNRNGIRYVVVGMSGINYFAKSPRETFGTMDYDVFLEPTLKNVKQAVQILKKLDFDVGTADQTLEEKDLLPAIRNRRTLVATTPDGLMIELLLEVSGFPFSELARDAVTFTAEGIPIRVGRLEKLLQSKRLAGRPKDLKFLDRYKSLTED